MLTVERSSFLPSGVTDDLDKGAAKLEEEKEFQMKQIRRITRIPGTEKFWLYVYVQQGGALVRMSNVVFKSEPKIQTIDINISAGKDESIPLSELRDFTHCSFLPECAAP